MRIIIGKKRLNNTSPSPAAMGKKLRKDGKTNFLCFTFHSFEDIIQKKRLEKGTDAP